MLNRTTSTLSANLNGLNLGTRSFAAAAVTVLNVGSRTLRLRHAHPYRCVDPTLRAEDTRGVGPISIMGSIPMPSSGSPPVSWCSARGAAVRSRVVVVAEAPPSVGPVVAGVPASRGAGRIGGVQGPWQPQPQADSKLPAAPRRLKRVAVASRRARGARAAATTAFAPAPAFGRYAFVPVARLRANGG